MSERNQTEKDRSHWLTRLIGKQPREKQSATTAEAQLSSLVGLVMDAIIIINEKQRITSFNRGAEELFGYEAADVLGQPLSMLIPDRHTLKHDQHVLTFKNGNIDSKQMGERQEITGLRKSGEEFPAEASIAKVTHGDETTFITIMRDVSERKREEAALLHSRERFRQVFQYSNDAILLMDPSADLILEANPRAVDMLGYSCDELQSMPPSNIHPHEIQRFKSFQMSVMEQGQGWTNELTCMTKSGSKLPSEMSASVIQMNGRPLVLSLIRDITERKELERMKDAFVSNVSHEIKTPITSIKMYCDLVQRNPAKQDRYIESINREINRLQIMIDELLYLSRIDQDRVRFDLRPVNISELVQDYWEGRRPLAESRGLDLQLLQAGNLPDVMTAPDLLGQVLSILLTNAFNYTPEGGEICICTQTRELKGIKWAGLTVSDSGLGIQKDEQKKIFERFYRGSSGKDSDKAGTGLGLSIAKEIVGRLGGRIEVESNGVPGQGSSFTVWLPAAVDNAPGL